MRQISWPDKVLAERYIERYMKMYELAGGLYHRTIEYYAPCVRCDRGGDREQVCVQFEKRMAGR